MRWVASAIGVSAALLLIAASIVMNWTFWTGQGADVTTARVLGAVSIGIDAFKAILPLVIAWAWAERLWPGYAIGMLFFSGCLGFSFFSAIGYSASSRSVVTGNREAVSLSYAAAEQELRNVQQQFGVLGAARPQAVVEEEIVKAKQDRRWASSTECRDATIAGNRTFCRSVADLRIELASSLESARLQTRSAILQTEINRLVKGGARRDADQQAGILAGLSGLHVEQVQASLSLLFALLVELGAAFGLFLALLPLRGHRTPGWQSLRPTPEVLPPVAARPKSGQRPTRFVRSADGQLMIE